MQDVNINTTYFDIALFDSSLEDKDLPEEIETTVNEYNCSDLGIQTIWTIQLINYRKTKEFDYDGSKYYFIDEEVILM